MYASHVCSSLLDIFQSVLSHLLQKINNLTSLSIGDCPPLSPIGISNTTSNSDTESSNTPLPCNCMTSKTSAPARNFHASENSETCGAGMDFAVSSLMFVIVTKRKNLPLET